MTLLQVTSNKLNSINNNIVHILAQNTDEETGEISEEVLDHLEKLQLKKEEITKVVGLAYHQYKSLGEQVKAEKDRLNSLQKQYNSSMESFKNMMDKILQGDTFECESFKCSYRKSQTVDLEEGFTPTDVRADFLRVKFELDKPKIKDYNKRTGILPEGVVINENNNLTIK